MEITACKPCNSHSGKVHLGMVSFVNTLYISALTPKCLLVCISVLQPNEKILTELRNVIRGDPNTHSIWDSRHTWSTHVADHTTLSIRHPVPKPHKTGVPRGLHHLYLQDLTKEWWWTGGCSSVGRAFASYAWSPEFVLSLKWHKLCVVLHPHNHNTLEVGVGGSEI